ncbi:S-adenosyl-L-methionine-dependent methyltransferase [Meredithblackwellia eburnea MCA 4105]
MDLLPQGNSAYAAKEYWNDRYTKEADGAMFDWFKTYVEIKPYFDRYIPSITGKRSRILMLGCGNSTLSKDLYDDGYHHITNIDYSEVCISRMSDMHRDDLGMDWLVGDVRSIPFSDGSFDVAIDKGTMDALMTGVKDVWNPSQEVVEACKEEVDEVTRVLAPGGVFIYLTFGQPHFRKQHLLRPGWDLEVVEIGESFFYYLYIMRRDSKGEVSISNP